MVKSIANLFEDEGLIKDLVDMISSFVLQVAKKDGNLYPPTMYNFLPFFECLYKWVSLFFHHVFFLLLSCICFYKLCVSLCYYV
jgi:hypothetical protein